jgi:hypothetical protein
MTLKRMDNMGIVVESLDAPIAFFTALGMRLEGRAMIEGEWAGRIARACRCEQELRVFGFGPWS